MSETTSAELEREAERTRAQVNETAERLRAKMTPGQILDELRDYVKEGDSALAFHNLKTQARDNPMALALIGSGLAWLMMGDGAKSTAANAFRSQHSESARASGATNWGSAQERDSGGHGVMHGLGESMSGMASGARDGVSGMASSAGDMASSAQHSVSDAMHGAAEQMSSFGSGVHRQGASIASDARHAISDLLEREPLIVGALGLAVGAALGAFLPATRVEREQLGETAAELREKAGEMAETAWNEAGAAASRTLSAARDAAEQEGISPDNLAAKAERVAAATTEAMEQEVDRAGGAARTGRGTEQA